MDRVLTTAQAIREALDQSLRIDNSVICFGLGTTDPKGVFGTTLDLHHKYGEERIFDIPTSENGMMGVAIGAALGGIRPVFTHQRVDFFLLAMDQLVNNAAKWHYMFGGRRSVPLTIRLIIGRGWGQGPTHSQSLQSWFAHVPGIKVVMPTFPDDSKGLLMSAIADDNPVVFLEHRWLHDSKGHVPEDPYLVPLGKAKLLCEGNDITIVSMSYTTIEALSSINALRRSNIHVDLIDLRSVVPMDLETISRSVMKTGRLMVLDTSHKFCSVGSEIVANISEHLFSYLKSAPVVLGLPDFPVPTSPELTRRFYPNAETIVQKVEEILGIRHKTSLSISRTKTPHDVPDPSFRGPF